VNLERLKNLFNPPRSTIELLNSFLVKEAAASPKSTKFGHKPSMLGSPCLRKIYYSYFRTEEEPLNAETIRIFKTGNYFEQMLMEWFRAINLHIPYRESDGNIPRDENGPDPQFRVSSPRWRIRMGKIDNVAYLGDKLWIFEIKSKKSSSFNKLKKPDDEHLIQVALYFQMLNDMFLAGSFSHIPEIKGKAEGVRIIYVNKDTSEMKEFVISKAELTPIILDIDKKISLINQYIDKKVLPPKTPSYCFTCPFKSRCDKNLNVK
jgi:hypothetical protein